HGPDKEEAPQRGPQFFPSSDCQAQLAEGEKGTEQEEAELVEKLQSPKRRSSVRMPRTGPAIAAAAGAPGPGGPGGLDPCTFPLGPLLLDPSLEVRERRRCLRGLSAGGFAVCEDMVTVGPMTRVALLREGSASGFRRGASTEEKEQNRNPLRTWPRGRTRCGMCVSTVMAQHLVCAQHRGRLEMVGPCLVGFPPGDLAAAGACCLLAVPGPPELLEALWEQHGAGWRPHAVYWGSLERVLRERPGSAVWNPKDLVPSKSRLGIISASQGLSEVLETDAGAVFTQTQEAEMEMETALEAQERLQKAKGGSDHSDEMEEALLREGQRICASGTDFRPLTGARAQRCPVRVPEQRLGPAWEEELSRDQSKAHGEPLARAGQLLSPLCLSPETEAALAHRPSQETAFPSSAAGACVPGSPVEAFVRKMNTVQCEPEGVSSLLSPLQAEPLGGALQALAQHLSTRSFLSQTFPAHGLLEAIGSAWRLLQTMAAKYSSQCGPPPAGDAVQSSIQRAAWGRVNMVSILGTAGSVLAKEEGVLEPLKTIGASAAGATKGRSLVVGGEAPALFHVFSNGNKAERASQMHLLPALKESQPVSKVKIKKREGRYSPDQLCLLHIVKMHWRRFVAYQET
uniref:SYO1-like TPR repeats domain-containing protein n=1 Tax=Myotis lucifugus TaxID=59463 RepID=G1QDU4_MYOLU